MTLLFYNTLLYQFTDKRTLLDALTISDWILPAIYSGADNVHIIHYNVCMLWNFFTALDHSVAVDILSLPRNIELYHHLLVLKNVYI